AHLAARDPLWQLLADLVTAALWWHPLAWVARRQHRLAGELAADDASQALPDGPVVLAECLLTLGHEAADCPRAALGMAGFRSQLGRRVERLLALPHRDWQAPSRVRLALQTTFALLALAALALLPGCAANRSTSEAPSSLVAKWWQAKQAPVAADVRRLQTDAERGVRNAESSQRLVTSSPAAEEEGRARLSRSAALAREIDEQRKALVADHQRAGADYKKLIESATDAAVSIAARDKLKQAAEAKLRELQQIEIRIAEFDRAARARLGESQRKLRDEIKASQRLVTSSPTNALDISVGRQLFVDDFLIASNTLKRTWHQPVLFSNTPLLARHDQIPPRHPFFESAWYDPTNQYFMLGLVNGTRFFTDYHSPSGTNWVLMHSQSHSGPLVDQPHRRVTTDYESLRLSLSREAGTDGIQFGFARAGAEPMPQTGQPAIPRPTPADGSLWTDMHPLRNGFLIVGSNLYCYFGGKVTNYGPRITVPGFHQEQAAIGLATLRRDGFASLDAGPEGGVMTTKPVTFTGRFLFVNMKTNAPGGELRIEILHPDGRPIEVTKNDTKERSFPFSRENCIPLAADQTLMSVTWQNWTNGLSTLAGRPVRFRFHLKNASLYSFWVGPGQLGRSLGRVAGGGPHFTNDVDTIGNRSYVPLLVKAGALAVGDYLRVEVSYQQGAERRTLRFSGMVAAAGYVPLPRVTKAVVVAGKTIEEATESIRQGYLAGGLEDPVVNLTKTEPPPAAPRPPPAPSAPAPKSGANLQPLVVQDAFYVVGVGDVLRVEVYRRPELMVESRVRERGDIRLPLLPSIAVSGKSIIDVREDIRAAYIRLAQTRQGQKLPELLHLDDPAVSVTLLQSALQPQPANPQKLPASKPGASIQPAPAPVAADVRKLTSPQTPDAKPQTPTVSQSLLTSAATSAPAAKNWTPAQRAILQRLDTVVFPEVAYDGLPLPEVVKMLQQDARKYDPEKKGFNFLLNSAAQPLEAPARIDLNTVLIKVTSVFRGLTLAQVLDLVCKTASEPIQFVVEDYGIVFTPRDRARPFVAPRLVERPAGVLTPAQRALLQRLDTVVFPEIAYDGLPLPEVIKFLETDGRKHDPEKKGFNFLLNSTGQHGDAATQVDLDVVLIHVNSVMKGLTLAQVLDVICKTADVRRPDGRNGGLQFVVEDYGIIFTPRDIATPFVAPRLVEQPAGAAVRAKLDKIVIPQVAFDGLPLPEVLNLLAQDARKHDPARQGVNILATRHFPDPPPGWRGLPVGPDGKLLPPVLDPLGNPIPGAVPPRVEPPDLDTVIINVPQVLNGLTLAQVLDVVCKTAGQPITYRVEDYGVLITPKYPAPPAPKPAAPRGALPVLEKSRAVVLQEIDGVQAKFAIAQRELAAAQRSGPPPEVERCAKVVAELDARFKAATAELARLDAQTRTKDSQSLVTSAATIVAGDSLRLTVAEDDSYDAIYPVKRDGSITVKGVGRVSVGGRRLNDAQAAVKALLEETQLPKATVTLEFVGERSGANTVSTVTNDQRVIYLAGEFLTPGPLKIPEGVQPTLITSIVRSGGLTPNGDLKRVKLLRINHGQGAVEEVNVAAILSGTAPPADKPLLPGDIIMVPAFAPAVHVTGSVVKPGPVSLGKDEKLTAYAAILRVGGFAPGASLMNCYVVRNADNGEKARLPLNVKEVQKDATKDIILKSGDIVVVPGSSPILPPTPKPGAAAPAPSPFAERGEKVAEGRMRGAATNAVAANPSPQPSPLAPQRERESAPPTPVGDDVRRLQSNAEGGRRNAESSQSLLTSAATNATPAPDPLQAAQEEALRRQERKVALDKLLGEAGQFLKVKSWTNAVVRYEEAIGHAKLLGGQVAERQGREALAGLVHCRIQLAIALQEKRDFKAAAAEVDKVLPFDPNNAAAEQFKRFNDRVEAAHKARLASPPATVRRAALLEERAKVMGLVRDGKLYYEVGEYDKARQRLEEAIALDPANEVAYYYLRLIQESQFEQDGKTREKTYSARVVEVSKKWNEAARSQNGLPVPNPYAKTNFEAPFLTHSSKGAQRINRKLDEIVLPEVHFDAVPLVGVVQRLIEDAKKFDPEPDPKKKGLNFLINDVAPAAPLLDAAGNPVPVARPVALSEGLVRVSQPLKSLTLRHALDVICKNAELPTQFSVEEYAIVFIPRGPVAYYSRIFRVNPDTFIQGLQGVVGSPVLGFTPGGGTQPGAASQNQSTTTTTGPVRATVPATVPATQRTAAEANALVRQFFQSAGVTALGATNGSTRVTFNPENGLLLVRGTTNDLRVIEQAIQKVQPVPAPATNAATNNLPKPNPYYRTNSPVQPVPHSSKGAQRNNRKLDEIILPEIHFDNVSLPAVVTWLDGNVKKSDPEKKGLNFLINNVVSDYISPKAAAPLLDPMGNPIVSTAAKPPKPDLENALIKVPSPIKALTLRQALDAICMTAVVKLPNGRTAGLKYSVEEYAIVFSPKLPEQASLFPRMFKVDPATFIAGLGSVVEERQLRPGSRAALDQALREKAWTNAPAGTDRFSVGGIPVANGRVGVVSTNVTAELNHLVRLYFTAAGVTDLGATNGPDATQVFFNDRNGLLLVRASLQDLDIIQQAVELLNAKPPQVVIEAKFVEISQNDNKAGGFDWFLGNTAVRPPEVQPDGVRRLWIDREGNYKLDGRARSLDQIEDELKAVSRTNAGVVVRIGAEHEARYSDATPVFERLSRIGITNSSFAVAPELNGLPVRQPTAVNPTGIFPQPAQPGGTPAATGIVTNKLARTNAVGLATLTGILTAPQFAVVMRALEQRDATSVRSLPKLTTPSGKPVVLELPADTKAGGGFAQGLKLEVLPSVAADGYTLSLTLIVSRDGKAISVSQCVAWDGQTVMLGGLELPGAAVKSGAKSPRVVLFLTPTIVNPTGHRVHTDEEMPFAPVVTPQPVPTKK
ncbi:MAG: peptidase M56 BlaR1, partial [Limisphaerales bacterium]